MSTARTPRSPGLWLLWGTLATLTLVDGRPEAGTWQTSVGVLHFSLFLLGLGVVSWRLAGCLELRCASVELAVATLALGAASIGVVSVFLGAIGSLREPFVVAVVLVALAVVSRRTFSGGLDRRDPTGREDWGARLAAAAAVALTVALVANDVHELRYEPPGAAFYDDVSYHLPEAATWLRYADLRMLRVEVGDKATTFYPIFGELMSWLAMALPGGHDFFARWSQLPAGLGLLMLVWALTKRAGGSNGGAALAVALALSVPRLLPDAMLSAGNDTWAAFWLCAALLFALRLADGVGFADALLLGAAAGNLVGVKYLGLLWLPVLAVAGIVAGSAKRVRNLSGRQVALGSVTFAGAAMTSGAFVYLRNLWILGNPVFPAPVSLFGCEILPGWAPTGLAARDGRFWTGIGRLGAFIERPELLGSIWSRLFLPSLILLPIAALVAVVRKRDAGARSLLAIATVMACQIAVYALWIPDRRDIRYVLAAPLLAGVVLAALLSRLPARWRQVVWVTGGVWVLTAALANRPQWLALAVVLGLAAGALVFPAPRWRPSFVVAVLGLTVVSFALGPTVSTYLRERDRNEPAARALARLTPGKKANVAYVGGNRPYFLYGTTLRNRVDVVPTQGAPGDRFYNWGQWTERDPYAQGKPGIWFANLSALEIDFVAIEGYGLESDQAHWLRRPRSSWRLAAEGPGYELWSLVVPAARPSKLWGARAADAHPTER